MSLEWRGGIPRTRLHVVGAGAKYAFDPPGTSKFVRLKNLSSTGAESVRVYWTQADFTADANYMTLDAVVATKDNAVNLPIEADAIWMKSDSGTPTVEVTTIHRRG